MILAVAWAKEHETWFGMNNDETDDNLKKTRSNPGNEKRLKDLDMGHGVPAATEY